VEKVAAFIKAVEQRRAQTAARLSPRRRSHLGQFFTPSASAGLLAAMPPSSGEPWRLLDPGAGVGSLSAALVARWLTETEHEVMDLVAYEMDPDLMPILRETLEAGQALAAHYGPHFARRGPER
jgi:adenine-specific DNA-methyltransferase